jgi:hypothetical protein
MNSKNNLISDIKNDNQQDSPVRKDGVEVVERTDFDKFLFKHLDEIRALVIKAAMDKFEELKMERRIKGTFYMDREPNKFLFVFQMESFRSLYAETISGI